MIFGYVRQAAFEQCNQQQKEVFFDHGVKGEHIHVETHPRSDAQGVIFKKLLKSLRPGDKLVVYRLASLARSLKGLNELFKQLKKREIAIQSIQEGIDTSKSDCEAFLQYSNAITTFTEDLRREKIMKGLASSSHKGGRPPALDEQEVQEVVKLLKNGESISEIARKFKTPRTTIYRIRDRHL